MELVDGIRDGLGGGTLSLWMIALGLLAAWLAARAMVSTVKLALFAGAAVLLLGVVPWSGQPQVVGPVADCAAAAVSEANSGAQAFLTKRVTVSELSADATCAGDVGLATGTATVRVRTYADIPFRTWTVSADGAVPR